MQQQVLEWSQQDSESAVFGAAFDTLPWWVKTERKFDYNEHREAPDGWMWWVTIKNPFDGGKPKVGVITHNKMRAAICKVARGEVPGVTDECLEACEEIVAGAVEVDPDRFDRDWADQVLQVAMFGKLAYPN